MSAKKSTLRREVTVDYLTEMGAAVACKVTLPEGTPVVHIGFVTCHGEAWAVDDVPLLMRLTGNRHDPIYRYCIVPTDAVGP